jgi:hypothetical protein
MGSLIDELQRREAAARAEAEELRGRIAELAERLAGVEERLSRLVITRETVGDVLSGAGADVPPRAAAGTEATGPVHAPAIGVLAVPPWRAGLEASVLPQAYRDLVEVAEDAGRPKTPRTYAATAAMPCPLQPTPMSSRPAATQPATSGSFLPIDLPDFCSSRSRTASAINMSASASEISVSTSLAMLAPSPPPSSAMSGRRPSRETGCHSM